MNPALMKGRGAAVASFPKEIGILTANGRVLLREDGTKYNGRGSSMFLLLGQLMACGNIDAQRQWMIATGINEARIFPDWTVDQRNNALDDEATWRVLHDDLLPMLRADGIRANIVPITQDASLDRHRRILARTYETVSRFELVEGANEPWNAGWDMKSIYNGINRHGILSATGYPGTPGPVFELLTWRSGRDLQHYFRNGKDAIDLYGYGAFVDDGEPLGVADYDKVGSAARSSSRKDHLDHHATARLFGASKIHSQFGLEGRAPGVDIPNGHPEYGDESKSKDICRGISEVWAAIPDFVYSGNYNRNGLQDFPLKVVNEDVKDNQGHAYASMHGNVAWVHVPGAVDGFTPQLINGWTTIEQIGPRDIALYKVTR